MEDFLKYEEAVALKELGFDWKCLAWYEEFIPEIRLDFDVIEEFDIPAPLYSQTFRWFRKKYNIDGEVCPYNLSRREAKIINNKHGKKYIIIINDNETEELKTMIFYDTYEEAELACIRKLIEIVKK